MSTVNGGFWDLDVEDRSAVMRAAEDRNDGVSFFDLPASERGRAYDSATGRGWDW